MPKQASNLLQTIESNGRFVIDDTTTAVIIGPASFNPENIPYRSGEVELVLDSPAPRVEITVISRTKLTIGWDDSPTETQLALYVNDGIEVILECDGLVSTVDVGDTSRLVFNRDLDIGSANIRGCILHLLGHQRKEEMSPIPKVTIGSIRYTREPGPDLDELDELDETITTKRMEERKKRGEQERAPISVNLKEIDVTIGSFGDHDEPPSIKLRHANVTVDKAAHIQFEGHGTVLLGDRVEMCGMLKQDTLRSTPGQTVRSHLTLRTTDMEILHEIYGACHLDLAEKTRIIGVPGRDGYEVLSLRGGKGAHLIHASFFETPLDSFDALREVERIEPIWTNPPCPTRYTTSDQRDTFRKRCKTFGRFHRPSRDRVKRQIQAEPVHSNADDLWAGTAHRWTNLTKLFHEKGSGASSFLMAKELAFLSRQRAASGPERWVLKASDVLLSNGCRIWRPIWVWLLTSCLFAYWIGATNGTFQVNNFSNPKPWEFVDLWSNVWLLPLIIVRAPLRATNPIETSGWLASVNHLLLVGAHIIGLLCLGAFLLAISRTFGRAKKFGES